MKSDISLRQVKRHRTPDTLVLGTITANCFDSKRRLQTPPRQEASSAITSHLCFGVSGDQHLPLSLSLVEQFSQLFASLQHEQNLSLFAGSQLNFILANLKDLYGSNFPLNC